MNEEIELNTKTLNKYNCLVRHQISKNDYILQGYMTYMVLYKQRR